MDTSMESNMDMGTGQRAAHRRGPLLGLGLAFVLSLLITTAQVIDAARGQELGFGDLWGALLVGVAQLVVVGAVIAGLRRTSAGVVAAGVVALAALAWLSMIVWWVAAPAYLGIAAASAAGLLDRDTPPSGGGVSRTAGIVGLFAAAANTLLVVGALVLTVVRS